MRRTARGLVRASSWMHVESWAVVVGLLVLWPGTAVSAQVVMDLSGYQRGCGVSVAQDGQRLRVSWPMDEGQTGQVVLNVGGQGPLIESLGVAPGGSKKAQTLLRGIDPVWFVTVGIRRTPGGKPADQKWRVFFDNPAKRPHQTFRSRLKLGRVQVASYGRRAAVSLQELTAGPFSGELVLTFYPGAAMFRIEAAVSTSEDRRAITYDAGLLGEQAGWKQIAWMDTEGRLQRAEAVGRAGADRPLPVRYRTIIAQGRRGSIACFPPPHQFQFPRDWTNNLGFVWFGAGHRGLADRFGFGVRQPETGGGGFVPWFNAPPGTRQRLSFFCLLTRGDAQQALRQTLRYTHGDRFPRLPGHLTLTSHWHMAVAVTAMKQQAQGIEPLPVPDFVRIFKDMGVDMVHLAEFHGDGHQKDAGPLRLPELQAMFDQCRRLSDDQLLLIPGEEVNTFLGIRQPGKHPGHWMSLFPKPVYWIMQRQPDQPFVQQHPKYGRVYQVGSRQDMVRLVRAEHGLVWSSHPRIKASSWTPDIFRHEDFYLADFWLGGAWKAMPGDLSHPKLGQQTLELLSDMANWGQKKYLLGEVDVFKIDHTHELYSHMNINYVRLERLPRFDGGWQPVLDALRGGRFFVTTGEVLISDFVVGGRRSGQTLRLAGDEGPELRAELRWTFPLQFAEVVSGDGQYVYRQRIDLTDTGPFGRRTLRLRPRLKGRRWVRLEVWDVAANGAFTQPVWLRGGPGRRAIGDPAAPVDSQPAPLHRAAQPGLRYDTICSRW